MSRNKRGGGADVLYGEHYGLPKSPNLRREQLIEQMYVRVLSSLAMNRFKWSGLPEEIDVRFMERTLFYRALSVFFKHEEFGKYMALAGSGNGPVDMLDNPTAYNVIGNNFIPKTISAKNCVPIWANYMRFPDLDIVTVYAHRLANIDRSVEINSANSRRNKVILTPDKQRLSWVNINNAIDEGLNGIQLSASGIAADVPNIIALDLGVDPMSVINLDMVGSRVWNKAMGMLGIENSNQDKKERLVSSEVDANNDQTSSMRRVNLNAREIACDQINKMFKLNVGVEYYTDEERNEILGPNEEDEEGKEDEE